MGRDLQFYETPIDKVTDRYPVAPLTDVKSSKECIPDYASDAWYFRDLEEKGIVLNDHQVEAVRHVQGPLLVIAGAGSGKTSVLASRAGYLLSVQGVPARNIMTVTFTHKAAEEIKERITRLPGLSKRMVKDITAGTFHSIFLKLLRSRGYHQNILYSEKKQHTMIKIILRKMNLKEEYAPETLLGILSNLKNNMIPVSIMPDKRPIEKEIKEIFTKYENWKRDERLMDFDDILLESYYLLQRDRDLLKSMQNRFAYILVDEFQDTNPLQYELLKMVAHPHNNLMVVGDDDQTIFGFNGASHENILEFDQVFDGCKKITLDTNYRSTASIVGLGNDVIRFNKKRHSKHLKVVKETGIPPQYIRPGTTDDEARLIVQQMQLEIKKAQRSFRDFAVLFRTSSCSRAIFEEMVLQNIPFISYTSKNTFYEHYVIKPVLDHFRLALDGKDFKALSGILPSLYLRLKKTQDFIQAQDMVDPNDLILMHILKDAQMPEYKKKRVKERIQLIKMLPSIKPVDGIRKIRDDFYDVYLETDKRKNLTVHKEMLMEMLDELEASAKRFESIHEFIGFVDMIIKKNKEMEQLKNDSQSDAVALMSIHRSKGLEFPVVFIIGASDGILPHSSSLQMEEQQNLLIKISKNKHNDELEEERRLLYVAVTRAKEKLFISSPSIYRHKPVEVSRFLVETFQSIKDSKEYDQQTA